MRGSPKTYRNPRPRPDVFENFDREFDRSFRRTQRLVSLGLLFVLAFWAAVITITVLVLRHFGIL